MYTSWSYTTTMHVCCVFGNQDWESDLTLFESGVKVIPENVKIQNNYAMELKSAGRLEEAKLHYQVDHINGTASLHCHL